MKESQIGCAMRFLLFALELTSKGRLQIRNNRQLSQATDVTRRRYFLNWLYLVTGMQKYRHTQHTFPTRHKKYYSMTQKYRHTQHTFPTRHKKYYSMTQKPTGYELHFRISESDFDTTLLCRVAGRGRSCSYCIL